MRIAVPWSLSHYIPLGGFHPPYRALFDHAPANISLIAWDNVKLHRHFARDPSDRERVSRLASSCQLERTNISPGSIATLYADHVYPPDAILTEALSGEVEFYHTAPFPSLRRPFIFHCESFAPVFFPCLQQGFGRSGQQRELRLHYQRIFANPLCQGIYSHNPETLDGFSNFFSDSAIDAKLFGSKIGLSTQSVDPAMFRSRKSLDEPRFLFISSAQRPEDFFNRGGYIALRFWKEFRKAGRDGMLVLRCRRPDDGSLALHGVDLTFIRSELGRSILWTDGYPANHEINALMANAQFLLLPGASPDSASILLAMTLGTIPVVTDAPGTSLYVADREHAIVLRGVRDAIWHLDPDIGVPVEHCERMPNVATALVTQLVNRVLELLDSKEALVAMSRRAAARARIEFSGEAFGSAFWESVTAKTRLSPHSTARGIAELTASLQNCTLDQGEWSRVFESRSQPRPLLDTGTSTVAELGGAVVNLTGSAPTSPADWSVFARYYSAGAPETIFAETLVELSEIYLPSKDNKSGSDSISWVRLISTALMRFPRLHAMASRSYRIALKFRKTLAPGSA